MIFSLLWYPTFYFNFIEQGVFATLSGPLYEPSSIDAPAEAESVECPANATNITDCWYSETKVRRINESEIISIACCPREK